MTYIRPWLRHPRIWITIGVVAWLLILAMWLLDRDPPTQVEGALNLPNVAPGGYATIDVLVRRNIGRQCRVSFARRFVDSNNISTDLGQGFVTADGLAEREKKNPGHLTVNVQVPGNASTGIAEVVTENRYTCPINPTTYPLILPIESVWKVQVNVVKP